MSLVSFPAAPNRRRFFSASIRACALAALVMLAPSCATRPTAEPAEPAWQTATHRLVGRIHSVDTALGYVVIDGSPTATDFPPTGTMLLSRTDDLLPTAQLRVSPFRQGRTLGADIIAGQPSPDDEVVWSAAQP